MSVTFTAMTQDGFAMKREPCLCSQMSDHFGAFVRGERTDFEVLRADASPDCRICGGDGVEEVRVDLRPSANFANGNAVIILNALGIEYDPASLCGECDLPTMKRAIMRARNVTHPEVLRERYESRHPSGGGVIQNGYTREQLMTAIHDLNEVVIVGERGGATKITWA